MVFYVLEVPAIDSLQENITGTEGQMADAFKVGDAPRCEACGEFVGMRRWLPPYRVELDMWGSKFGDVAFASSSELLVSRRFRQLWEESGLVGLGEFEPVEIVKVVPHRGPLVGEVPVYFKATVCRSQAAIDLVASGFEFDTPPQCSFCLLGSVRRWKRIVIGVDTWSGEDIFFARGLAGTIIVSARFKRFCETNDIANAALLPAEEYGYDFYPSVK